MDVDDIRRLCRYDAWANARFFTVIEGLTEQQYAAPLVSSFRSVRDTLAHLVSSEWIWVERFEGRSPTEIPAWAERPGVPALREKLAELDARRDRFVASLTPETLARPLDYRRLNGERYSVRLSDCLVHVVNHGTYHRGQLTTLLRQVGATPPGTDYATFAGEEPA